MSKTRDQLKAEKFVFSDFGHCNFCHEEIEWYFSPKGKSVPFNLMPNGKSLAVEHSRTCEKQK